MAATIVQTPPPIMASVPVQSPLQNQNQLSSGSGQRNKNAIFGLGITEVILGTTSIALGITALILRIDGTSLDNSVCVFPYTIFSAGVWCGALTVVTGILGIVMKKKPTRVINILNITMAIFTAVAMLSGIALSGVAAVASILCSTALVVLNAVIALLCFVLFIISIVHAALCCGGASYRENFHPTPVLYTHQQHPYVQQQYYGGEVNRNIAVNGAGQAVTGAPHAYDNLMHMQ